MAMSASTPSASAPSGANSDNWCTTKSQLYELSSTWNIEHASLRLRPLVYMESSKFYSSDRSIKWRMCLDLKKENGKDYVNAYLKIECEEPVHAEYDIFTKPLGSYNIQPFDWRGPDNPNFRPELTTFYNRLSYHINAKGTLAFACKMKAIRNAGNVSGNPTVQQTGFQVCVDIDLLHQGKYTDVVIAVGKREIKAHKFMLASHSSVFRAMFDSNMRESSTNRVVITDLDGDVVDEMLHFIYTGKSPRLKAMADRLLGAAEKYSLVNLRALCEEALCADLSVDNTVKLMTLANLYDVKKLKPQVSQFMRNNMDKVMETTAWREMMQQTFKLG